MGEHEYEPSSKRSRRGSVVKYRHKDFTISSSPELLNSIKRRTCPSGSSKIMRNKLKKQQKIEADNLLIHMRLLDIELALNSEIRLRKESEKRRKLARSTMQPNQQTVGNNITEFLVQSDMSTKQKKQETYEPIDLESPSSPQITLDGDSNEISLDLISQTAGEIATAVKNVDFDSTSINDNFMDAPYGFDFLTSL